MTTNASLEERVAAVEVAIKDDDEGNSFVY